MTQIRLVLLLIAFWFTNTVNSQTTFFTILKYNNDLNINCVTPISDRNYIATGVIKSLDNDVLIAKIDTLGNYLWSKKIGYFDEVTQTFTNDAGLRLMSLPADTGFLVLGTTLNGENTILLKYKNQGNIVWQKRFNKGYNTPTNIYTRSDNNGYIITGSYTDISDASLKRPFLIKTEKDGSLTWSADYRYSKWPESVGAFTALAPTDDDAYFAAGFIKENSAKTSTFLYLAKINKDGAILWDKTVVEIVSKPSYVYLYKLAKNDYMLVAATATKPNKLSIYHFDNTGTLTEPAIVTLPGYTFPENILIQNNTLAFVTNTTTDTTGCYFARLGDISKPFQSNPIVYSSGYSYKAKFIAPAPDSGFIAVTEYTVPNVIQKRACVIKLNKFAVCNAEPQTSLIGDEQTKVSNNYIKEINIQRVNDALRIENITISPTAYYEIVDFSGKILLQGQITSSAGKEISIQSLSKGFYAIRIFDKNVTYTAKFVK